MSESADASAGSLPGPRTTSGPSPAPLLVAANLPQAPAQVGPRVSRPGAITVRPATAAVDTTAGLPAPPPPSRGDDVPFTRSHVRKAADAYLARHPHERDSLAGHCEREGAVSCLVREAREEVGLVIEPNDVEFVHLVRLVDSPSGPAPGPAPRPSGSPTGAWSGGGGTPRTSRTPSCPTLARRSKGSSPGACPRKEGGTGDDDPGHEPCHARTGRAAGRHRPGRGGSGRRAGGDGRRAGGAARAAARAGARCAAGAAARGADAAGVRAAQRAG
ncbi:NUDIX domain-containing protein [Streptomyces sp. NPDC014748]|uniref:NUDIX domain-containing protein n=1 Tax=Streptomyces sp. NPDC014748 TaxID=3364905 RepID=UPI0036F85AFC